MRGKAPAFQFYPGDWLKDPALTMCSQATRGAWIDMLAAMWEVKDRGVLQGTVHQLARVCRCSPEEMDAALHEIEANNVANITRDNGVITVMSRRMIRDEKNRKNNAVRQTRYRNKQQRNAEDNNIQTPPSHRSSSSSSSSSDSRDSESSGQRDETGEPQGSDSGPQPNAEDWRLAGWMQDLIVGLDIGFKPRPKEKLKRWANDIRLMRERDNRTHREIAALFKWANDDGFWRANILSPGKLRAKWPQLEAQRKQVKGNGENRQVLGDEKRDYHAGAEKFKRRSA